MKEKIYKKINFIVVLMLVFTCFSVTTLEYSTVNAQSKIEVSKPKFPHVWRKSNTSLNISDYAYPCKWINLDEIFDESKEVLTKQKEDLNEVASFFSQHTNIRDGYLQLDEHDNHCK